MTHRPREEACGVEQDRRESAEVMLKGIVGFDGSDALRG